ncbi:MAG: ketoacyl-ACP synthase III [Armatimonadetes bacterium]|nr:ketoacyl-ACP synthase III [Armatimonadota bacterium]
MAEVSDPTDRSPDGGRLRGATILGVGMAVPERVVTNADLERVVDTSDEWIVTRTGIRERRVVSDGECTSDLAAEACLRALADANVGADQVDLVLCATCTGDYIWPATACLVQDRIGAIGSQAFDVAAACAGFVYGVQLAGALVQAGAIERALVVGADTMTRHVDWSDRKTCVLFGDGAGAVVLGPTTAGDGLLGSAMGADGSRARAIYLPGGGTRMPLTAELLERRLDKLVMDGSEVFRFAVRIMAEACAAALLRAGLSADDVDLFLPHQANIRIIKAAAERMGLSDDRVYNNVDRYGNTSAASVPIALCEAVGEGRVARGDLLVFVGFGAGLTWGANVVRWTRDEVAHARSELRTVVPASRRQDNITVAPASRRQRNRMDRP